MKPELQLAAQLGSDHVESLDANDAPILSVSDPTSLRALLQKELQHEEIPAQQVIQELHRDASPGICNTGSGRYFGFVIGGTLPVAIAAEWLVSSWDQNAGAFFVAPSAAVIEEVVGEWLLDLFGLPMESSFALVTGCQAAHLTCLAAARHYLLQQVGYNVETQGLFGAPPIRVLVGKNHETLLRALRFLGIGTNAIVQVDTNKDGTMDLGSLRLHLDKDPDALTIVSVAAGELNQGLFDDIGEVCNIAHEYKHTWVHVDGAFGMWASTSSRFRHLTKGMELADSWATDTHKWLNVPQDCGVAICRHSQAHRDAMSIHAPYAIENNSVRDEYHWGPEWSRRARGVAVYAAMRSLGKQGIVNLVERCCDYAAELVQRLGELDDTVEVLAKPIVNQGLVRFLDKNNGKNHDARTDSVIEKINEGGEVWFGGTTWNGMRVMRISVCSHRTSSEDIDVAVRAVKRAIES